MNYCYFELIEKLIYIKLSKKKRKRNILTIFNSSVTGLSRENKSVVPRSRCTGEAIRQGQRSSRED